jgi:hypothetical protein
MQNAGKHISLPQKTSLYDLHVAAMHRKGE